MNLSFKRLSVIFFVAVLFISVQEVASQAGPAFKTIQNTGGGTIVYGPLSSQLSFQAALSETLKQVDSGYGDHPQLGKVLQNKAGTVWEGFFTVTNKKSAGAKMTGLVIVYVPKTGTAGGATLIDTSDRFPQSVNSMFQRLEQEVTNSAKAAQNTPQGSSSGSSASASAANANAAPAQKLQPVVFPDGSGSMGLPQGWTMSRAQLGDVTAKGANGEALRFGLMIAVLDPTNPQSRALTGGRNIAPGNMVLIPYSSDPGTVFKSAAQQLAQKARVQPATMDVTKTQPLPIQGGKNYLLFGTIDRHDGQGSQSMVAQMIISAPQAMGSWQITIFQLTAPQQVMQQEAATVAEIFPNYSRNTRYVNAVAMQQIQEGLAQTRQFIGTVGQYMSDSDRMTQGMSDMLRGQTVIRDTNTGVHIRTSDDLAGALVDANPNLFEAVPLSRYQQGVDY